MGGAPRDDVVGRRRAALLLGGVWLALALGQAARLAATGSLMSGDGVYHFAHLHSLVVDRDLDPADEIRYFREDARSRLTGGPKIGNRMPRNPATGEVVNKYPIGVAVLTLPAYLSVYLASTALHSLGVSTDVSGYGRTYQYAGGLLIALYATSGLWFAQRVSRASGAADDDAWWGTLLAAFATPWLFYATLEPFFSHALSATGAMVLTWQWLRARDTDDWRQWWMVGLIAGIAATVRYQDAVLLVIPLLDLVATRHRSPLTLAVNAVATGAGVVIGALPQLVVNWRLFGNPFTTGYFGETFDALGAPWVLYTLFSSDVGWVRWTPAVAIALAGLGIAAGRGSRAARLGLVFVAIQVYLVASWYFVSQGHTFGNRMLVNFTVFVALGLSAALSESSRRPALKTALQATGVALAGANLLLIWLWTRGLIGPLGRLG